MEYYEGNQENFINFNGGDHYLSHKLCKDLFPPTK